MYSHELVGLIKNGLMNRIDYLENVNPDKSPQIIEIHYDTYTKEFYVKTRDNYNLKFKIKEEA